MVRVKGKGDKTIEYGKWGMFIGVGLVIVTLVWILKISLCQDTTPDEVTWVG